MYYGTPPISTNGLIHHFDALNTLSYNSGSSNWFSIGNPSISASLFTSSFSNNVLLFNGTSSFANINNLTLSGPFTINVVFNPSITPSSSFLQNEPLLGTNSGSLESRNIGVTTTSSITLRNMGVYIEEDYPIPTIQPNRYYCLSIVRNNDNTINTYLNGIRTDLGISSTQYPSEFKLDTIGNSLQAAFFAGALPVFSTYNRALSESEIKQYVSALNPRYNFDTTLTNKPLTTSILDMLKVRSELESSTFDSQMYSSSLADLNRINSLGLLDSASLVITPATYKEGLLYNIKPKKSTYNLLKYTQDFTTAGWSFIRMSASYGYHDPIGGNTATLLTATGSTTYRMNQNITLVPNNIYNISWYVSQSNTRYANIAVLDSNENIGSAARIDFDTQTIQQNPSGFDALSGSNYQLTSEGNGWYRASFNFIPSSSYTLYKSWVLPNTASNDRFGSQSGSAIYIWGSQITKGTKLQPYQRIISASTPDINYVRASTTTAIDKNGYVSSYPYNLIVDTDNGLTIGGGTVERNVVLAPDGTYTADKFTKTDNLNIQRAGVALDSSSPHNGTQFTLSFWSKLADTGSTINMPPQGVEIFPFSGSTALTPIYPGTYTITNQWQKQTFIFSIFESLVTSLSVRVARNSSATGDNGRSFSIWGTQLTKGSGSLDFQKNLSRLSWPTIDYSAGQPAIRAAAYSENFFLWSNDLNNSVWIKDGITVSTSSLLSPSGEYNTLTLTATSSNATIKQYVNAQNRVGLFSVYMRRKTGSSPILLTSGPFSSSIQPTSQWQRYENHAFRFTGSYTSSAGVVTVTTTIPHGFEVGDRIGFAAGLNYPNTYNTASSVPDPFTVVFVSGSGTGTGIGTITPQGGKITITQQGDEIDVWGPQLLGTGFTDFNDFRTTSSLQFNKEFVPTAGASVNRPTDNINILNLSSSILTNPDSGSIYVEFAYPYSFNPFYTSADMLNFFNSSGSNTLRFTGIGGSLNTPVNSMRWQYLIGGSTFTSVSPNNGLLTFRKHLLTFTKTRMKYFYQGSQVGSTITLTLTSSLDLDRIQTPSGQYMLIKNISYFPYELTDAQAIALTTP